MQPRPIDREYQPLPRGWTASRQLVVLTRFAGKIVHDVLPAALASVIGGFLFTQYQFGHNAVPRPATEAVVPASAEMMALVRDEHAVIVDYLKAQMAAEKSRLAAADADAARGTEVQTTDTKPIADAKAAEAPIRHIAAAAAAPKSAAPHPKPPAVVAAVPHAPLVIAEAQQTSAAAPADRLARDPDSLLAKALDAKDHMVAATLGAVSAIGNMFASVGERIVGPASARPFNAAS
jgi:hypothetical protein